MGFFIKIIQFLVILINFLIKIKINHISIINFLLIILILLLISNFPESKWISFILSLKEVLRRLFLGRFLSIKLEIWSSILIDFSCIFWFLIILLFWIFILDQLFYFSILFFSRKFFWHVFFKYSVCVLRNSLILAQFSRNFRILFRLILIVLSIKIQIYYILEVLLSF